jgi:hypothetical protein
MRCTTIITCLCIVGLATKTATQWQQRGAALHDLCSASHTHPAPSIISSLQELWVFRHCCLVGTPSGGPTDLAWRPLDRAFHPLQPCATMAAGPSGRDDIKVLLLVSWLPSALGRGIASCFACRCNRCIWRSPAAPASRPNLAQQPLCSSACKWQDLSSVARCPGMHQGMRKVLQEGSCALQHTLSDILCSESLVLMHPAGSTLMAKSMVPACNLLHIHGCMATC